MLFAHTKGRKQINLTTGTFNGQRLAVPWGYQCQIEYHLAKLLAYNQDIKVQGLKDILRELNCRITVCRLLLTKGT